MHAMHHDLVLVYKYMIGRVLTIIFLVLTMDNSGWSCGLVLTGWERGSHSNNEVNYQVHKRWGNEAQKARGQGEEA